MVILDHGDRSTTKVPSTATLLKRAGDKAYGANAVPTLRETATGLGSVRGVDEIDNNIFLAKVRNTWSIAQKFLALNYRHLQFQQSRFFRLGRSLRPYICKI